jgi:hypothetical protein
VPVEREHQRAHHSSTSGARSLPGRLLDAWSVLEPERRLAAFASLGLFVSMFLHWYSKTNTLVVRGAIRSTQTSLSAFQAFSFVEAAVLLVSVGVLAMLFARAEGRTFNLPGGDGVIVMIAGGWTALLIFYRLLDKPGLQGNERVTATVGVEWGIFVALLVALGLLYAGRRMRTATRASSISARRRSRLQEEPSPTESTFPGVPAPPSVSEAQASPERPRHPPSPAAAKPPRPVKAPATSTEQLSFEDQPPGSEETDPRA